MKTTIVPINNSNALEHASALLKNEEVIAAPTDTVYGLMCRYDSVAAIKQIYEIKGRPPQKAIPILVADREQLAGIVRFPLDQQVMRLIERLMERFWPGPLTLVLQACNNLPAILTAGQPTVAVRVPQHEHLCTLIRGVGPLAVTSANLSGNPETHSANDVMMQLGDRIPIILADDPPNNQPALQLASTILDLSAMDITQTGSYKFLRQGPIHMEVSKLLEEVEPQDKATLC